MCADAKVSPQIPAQELGQRRLVVALRFGQDRCHIPHQHFFCPPGSAGFLAPGALIAVHKLYEAFPVATSRNKLAQLFQRLQRQVAVVH